MVRRVLGLALVGLAAAAWPARALADGFEARLGAFTPRGGSASQPASCGDVNPVGCNLFLDLDELFGASRHGWTGLAGGIEYNHRLSRKVEVAFSLDGYARTRSTAYLDYGWEGSDADVRQNLHLSTVPLGMSLRVSPLGTRRAFSPYVAVGADIVFWRYAERGDFVDPDTLDIQYVDRSVSGATPGLHAAAGVRIPLNHDLSATAEARYLLAGKDRMSSPYEVYDVDVSGLSATFGLQLRF